MVRSPCCHDDNLKKGPWTPEEDEKLVDYISRHGHGNWKALPKHAGLNRCGKSCRLRWTNYLRPDIKRGKFSEEEERLIINLHSVLGNKWSRIATHLPGRTDNEIKNFWNTHIRKKLLQMGIDPNTHKPRTDFNNLLNLSQLIGAAHFGNLITPLENVLKLQADAAQFAKLQLLQNLLEIINTCSLPNIEDTSFLRSQNLNSFQSLPNEATAVYTKTPTPTSQDLTNLSVIPQMACDFQATTNSWACHEGEFSPGGFNINDKTLSTPYDTQTENPLPELVSASASIEASIVNQMESKANPSIYSMNSPISTVFEAWEKLMGDETCSSYWNDILK